MLKRANRATPKMAVFTRRNHAPNNDRFLFTGSKIRYNAQVNTTSKTTIITKLKKPMRNCVVFSRILLKVAAASCSWSLFLPPDV
jgi:hypothetical protein